MCQNFAPFKTDSKERSWKCHHGLVLFLACIRSWARHWRTQMLRCWRARLRRVPAAAALALVVWGFSVARQDAATLWTPPVALRHSASLLTLAAFVLVTAAYVPANHFKVWLGHPMLAGTALWALAHLLANGKGVDVLLFGSFLVWAVLDFNACRRRDRAQQRTAPAGTARGTALAVVVGGALWVLFALVLHARLMGVSPLG
jgi:uncharacterized membrane protein